MTAPSRRLIISCLLMLLASLAFALWGLRSGAVMLDSSQVINALTGSAPRAMQLVVIEWRLPRVLMALLIGAALGVSGAIFQSLMRNPLGSPDVMGFNTGAWSGVLVAMVFFWSASDGDYARRYGGRHSDVVHRLVAGVAQRH